MDVSLADIDAQQPPAPIPAATCSQEYVRPELSDAFTQIRLLRLLPVSPMRCQLSVHNIEDVAGLYIAISYTWGPATPTAKIYMKNGDQESNQHSNFAEGMSPPIRRDCLYALGQVRRHYPNELFWIDSICIYQDRHREKQKQVARMGSIYASASFVVACLGRAGPDHHFFDGNRLFLQYVQQESAACQMLSFMARRPYFQRLWTVQEILLAPSIEIVCGLRKLDMETFRDNLDIVNKHIDGLAYNDDAYRNLMSLLRDCGSSPGTKKQSHEPLNLAKVITTYSWRECFDPRDKIYGLLSLCPAPTRDLIAINYSIPLIELLRNYAATQNNTVLYVSELQTPSCPTEFTGLIESLTVLRDDFKRRSPTFQQDLDKIYLRPCFTMTQSVLRKAVNGPYFNITVNDSATVCHRISQDDGHNLALGPYSCDQLVDLGPQLYCSLVTRQDGMCSTAASDHISEDCRRSWFHFAYHRSSKRCTCRGARRAKLLLIRDCDSGSTTAFIVPRDTEKGDCVMSSDQSETLELLTSRPSIDWDYFISRPSVDGLNIVGEAIRLRISGHYHGLQKRRTLLTQTVRLSIDELLSVIMRSAEKRLSALEHVTQLVQQTSRLSKSMSGLLLDETPRPPCLQVMLPTKRNRAGFCERCCRVWWRDQRFWRMAMCIQCRALSEQTSEETQYLYLRGFVVSDLRRKVDRGIRMWTYICWTRRDESGHRRWKFLRRHKDSSEPRLIEGLRPSRRRLKPGNNTSLILDLYYKKRRTMLPVSAEDLDWLSNVFWDWRLANPSHMKQTETHGSLATKHYSLHSDVHGKSADSQTLRHNLLLEFLQSNIKSETAESRTQRLDILFRLLCNSVYFEDVPEFNRLYRTVYLLDLDLQAYCKAAEDARCMAGHAEHVGLWRWIGHNSN